MCTSTCITYIYLWHYGHIFCMCVCSLRSQICGCVCVCFWKLYTGKSCNQTDIFIYVAFNNRKFSIHDILAYALAKWRQCYSIVFDICFHFTLSAQGLSLSLSHTLFLSFISFVQYMCISNWRTRINCIHANAGPSNNTNTNKNCMYSKTKSQQWQSKRKTTNPNICSFIRNVICTSFSGYFCMALYIMYQTFVPCMTASVFVSI